MVENGSLHYRAKGLPFSAIHQPENGSSFASASKLPFSTARNRSTNQLIN